VSVFATPPISPMRISFDPATAVIEPAGPVLTRRMSDLEGLFTDSAGWKRAAHGDDPVVYTVHSSPVPEIGRELPQSITTIQPGDCGGEFYMTKGHQHPDPQGEIYLGLTGVGGLLLFDGENTEWIDMEPGVIGYIPPHWAHRSVNVGDEPYRFLAVYPGGAGHDYQWVLDHGMGARAVRAPGGYELRPYGIA
jgi:glucose-6-phosphate isomerase